MAYQLHAPLIRKKQLTSLWCDNDLSCCLRLARNFIKTKRVAKINQNEKTLWKKFSLRFSRFCIGQTTLDQHRMTKTAEAERKSTTFWHKQLAILSAWLLGLYEKWHKITLGRTHLALAGGLTPECKWQTALALRSKCLTRPLKRVYMFKRGGGLRPLGIVMHVWSCTSKKGTVETIFPDGEAQSDPPGYGFWSYRGTTHSFNQMRHLLTKAHSLGWVLDRRLLKKRFDTIDHDWLLTNQCVLRRWWKAPHLEGYRLFSNRNWHILK